MTDTHDHVHEDSHDHDLHHQIHDVADKVNVGGYYKHYKNGQTYRLLGLGFIEANEELAAIYQAQYGDHLTFIRPLAEFLATVDGQPRFAPTESGTL